MKIRPHEKEKAKIIIATAIDNLFDKPNKLGYNFTESKGGFEMKEVKRTISKPPLWFVEFANQVVEFMKEQKEFNKEMKEFKAKQEEFNKTVLEFIKQQIGTNNRIEKRLDNIVNRNNLIE